MSEDGETVIFGSPYHDDTGVGHARVYKLQNGQWKQFGGDLEGAEDALVFTSGMAAICTTLINFLGQGDRIVTTRNLYGGTVGVLDQDFTRFGIDVHYIDVRDLDAVENAFSRKIDLTAKNAWYYAKQRELSISFFFVSSPMLRSFEEKKGTFEIEKKKSTFLSVTNFFL